MSLTPAQLKTQIRFHLSDLKSRSAHHEFEQLARNLARLRLYSNLLPATGPVAAGGDQGRDFESYGTELDANSPSRAFRARTSGGRTIAGACTLQQENLPGKIRKDFAAILTGGPVDEVVFFSEANIPVSERHKAQAWARGQDVTLQIFDGEAIAEMLCDRDVFWIAQAYLNLPGEIMPPGDDQPEEYRALLARWRDRTVMPFSFADFVEVKSGLRHANSQEGARPDLRSWMAHMEQFIVNAVATRDLTRSASYELCVASFRGMDDMNPQIDRLVDYYRDTEEFTDLADLQNAVTLLNYADTALMYGRLDLAREDLASWHYRLKTLLDMEVGTAAGPNRRTGLLRIRGQLLLTAVRFDSTVDPGAAFDDWDRLMDEAEGAPLFPLEPFADYLLALVTHMGSAPVLLALSSRVDDAIARRSGANVAGEKAALRATALLEQGDKLAALKELHAVKRKWFSGERIGGSVRSLIMLADVYRQLGLAYAAKYYALAAAYIATHSDQANVRLQLPDALFEAIDAEDGAGNSFGFIQLMETAIGANFILSDDPLELEHSDRVRTNLAQISALIGCLKRVQPELEAPVNALLSRWPDILRTPVLESAAAPDGFWNKGDWSSVWSSFQGRFLGRPFGDLGPERRVSWRALGIRWTAVFPNTYQATPMAEQLIAQLQLVQCALASEDLCLLPTEVVLNLAVTPDGEVSIAYAETSGPVTFDIVLPTDLAVERVSDIVQAALAPIRICSLLPDEALTAAIRRVYGNMASEMFVGRPYAELYRDLTSQDDFFETERNAVAGFQTDVEFDPPAVSELAWREGPGPTYDPDFALKDVAFRYKRLLACVGLTAARLRLDPRVGELLEDMHHRGLPDWEILAIIGNIAAGHRTGLDKEDLSDEALEEAKSRLIATFDVQETTADIIPPEIFDTELLKAHEKNFVFAHLNSWRLTIAPHAWDVGMVTRFLTSRYGMRVNDVPHDDVFGWPDQGPCLPTAAGQPEPPR